MTQIQRLHPHYLDYLSLSNTNITQLFQIQQASPQMYDPPPIPPQYSTQTNTHKSPQQGSSNTTRKKTPFQSQPELQF